PAAPPRDNSEPRRIECEFGEAGVVDLSAGENPLWGGIVQQRKPGLDALCRFRADGLPDALRAALEQAVLGAGDDFDRDDVFPRPTRKHARRPEPFETGLGPLAGDSEGRNKAGRKQRRRAAAPSGEARRRHHTSPPASATAPGNTSTVVMKIQRI